MEKILEKKMEVRGDKKRGDFGEFGGLGPPWRFASDGAWS